MLTLADLDVPVVLAPMAGGPSTPELAAAVSDSGGLGFLAAATIAADRMASDIAAARALTRRPLGVNLFDLRGSTPADPAVVSAYAGRLTGPLGEPTFDDDRIGEKLGALLADPVPVVSFTFGCPGREDVDALHRAGSAVWVTVTTPAEARHAQAVGADAVIAQGAEAGGHQGAWTDHDAEPLGLLPLLQLLDAETGLEVPVVAAGGIATARGVAAVLAAGAAAAQVGTAFMRCPEAGTHPAHADRLARDEPTGLTRAWSGRRARGIVNRFQAEHPDAPSAYPEIHRLTTPLRAEARSDGDTDRFNLWAGQAHALAEQRPAAEVVASLAAELRTA